MPPKGKIGTKGQKQIAEENVATLNFYLYIMCGVTGVHCLLTFVFFWEAFTTFYNLLMFLCIGIYIGCYKFMTYMAKSTLDERGQLIDAGTDLNLENGLAEHVKDMILLTAGVQGLSLISNYFWLLLLAAPCRAFHLLWVNFLGPWFFEPAPEVSEKKQKKMERKMKRRQ